MLLNRPPHTFQAHLLRFADADTVVLRISLGLDVSIERYVRLKGIESHELTGPHRAQALGLRDKLNELIADEPCLLHLTSQGRDRYGRLRGHVTIRDQDLARWLVENSYAWFCTARASAQSHRESR